MRRLVPVLLIAYILSCLCLCSLPHNQMARLMKITVPHLYSTLELFVQWVKDGMYDFHRLPYAMKRHISEEDKLKLQGLQSSRHYAGVCCRPLQWNP